MKRKFKGLIATIFLAIATIVFIRGINEAGELTVVSLLSSIDTYFGDTSNFDAIADAFEKLRNIESLEGWGSLPDVDWKDGNILWQIWELLKMFWQRLTLGFSLIANVVKITWNACISWVSSFVNFILFILGYR